MRHHVLQTFGALVAMLLGGAAVHAEDRGEVQAQARSALAQLRTQGEPKNRCGMNAWFVDGPMVVRTAEGSSLLPGDQLLEVDGKSVAGKSAQEVVSILRSLPATAKPLVKIQRAGDELIVDQQCSDARSSTETIVQALDFASSGKFDDCYGVLRERHDLGSAGALLRAQCAAVAKKYNWYDDLDATFDALKMQLEDARWNAVARSEMVMLLRANEGKITQGLGAAKSQELVAFTRKWPGDEGLYDASAPNWSLFKRNGEAALKGRLVDPESARIEWPHGFTYGSWKPLLSKRVDGYWTCGRINARNRMGGYTGSTYFVVVLEPKGSVQWVDMGDGKEFDLISAQCQKSIALLPPAPPEQAQLTRAVSTPSLADELRKLADLKAAGALSENEFEAAKKKLLGN